MPNDEKSEEDAPPVETTLGAPDIVGKSKEPYLPDATRPDDYRCLLSMLNFRKTRSLRERVVPGALSIVHHVLVYVVVPEDVPGGTEC